MLPKPHVAETQHNGNWIGRQNVGNEYQRSGPTEFRGVIGMVELSMKGLYTVDFSCAMTPVFAAKMAEISDKSCGETCMQLPPVSTKTLQYLVPQRTPCFQQGPAAL